MRRGILLDHIDARAAVLGDLVDVGAFHETEADVGTRPVILDVMLVSGAFDDDFIFASELLRRYLETLAAVEKVTILSPARLPVPLRRLAAMSLP